MTNDQPSEFMLKMMRAYTCPDCDGRIERYFAREAGTYLAQFVHGEGCPTYARISGDS